MTKVLHTKSTLTDRYQTTIPESVRAALHLRKRDKIEFVIEDNGRVIITRADENDPLLGKFLTFIANDIKKHPDHIKSVSSALYSRAQELVSDVEVDLNAPLSEKDE